MNAPIEPTCWLQTSAESYESDDGQWVVEKKATRWYAVPLRHGHKGYPVSIGKSAVEAIRELGRWVKNQAARLQAILSPAKFVKKVRAAVNVFMARVQNLKLPRPTAPHETFGQALKRKVDARFANHPIAVQLRRAA
jgi:hypothetical protein